MIITSDSIEYNYSIKNIQVKTKLNECEDVVWKVQVNCIGSMPFQHTIEEYQDFVDEETNVKRPEKVLISKDRLSVEIFYESILDVDGVSSSSFTSFSDLTEEQVLEWCFNSEPQKKTLIEQKIQKFLLRDKDRIENPQRSEVETMTPPWMS